VWVCVHIFVTMPAINILLCVQHEQPDLATKKSALLRREEELKVQLATLEKELLEALAESSGNILENTPLIESLTKTKVKSADVAVSLESSARASEELDRYARCTPCGGRGASQHRVSVLAQAAGGVQSICSRRIEAIFYSASAEESRSHVRLGASACTRITSAS
jgi:hypothetical protein